MHTAVLVSILLPHTYPLPFLLSVYKSKREKKKEKEKKKKESKTRERIPPPVVK